MVCRPLLFSVLFASNGAAQRYLDKDEHFKTYKEPYRHLIAGVFSGFCLANVAFIFDTLKVRAQERKESNIKYWSEFKHII